MRWRLPDRVKTDAGIVAAGQTGSGPALVLAHGWPWSSFAWHRIIPTLAETHAVYWYDMPGYGQSDKSADQPTSLDVQGRIFAQMLDHWGLFRPTIIAHDFGGATTLRAHLLHGVDCNRYVLLNVVAMRPWGSAFFDHVGRHIDAFTGLPPHIHAAIVKAYIKGALASDIDPDDLTALVDPWLTPEGSASFYRQFAQADEHFTAEVEPHYSKIRCPTHILWGVDDPWIPLSRGHSLHAAIGHASFAEIPDAGHLAQLENPTALLDQLLPHLASGTRPGSATPNPNKD